MAENDDMKGKRMPKSVSKAELRLKKRSRTELDSPILENATTNAIVNESRELINEDKKLGHENSIMDENSMASNTSVATESPIADSSYGIKEIFIGRESCGRLSTAFAHVPIAGDHTYLAGNHNVCSAFKSQQSKIGAMCCHVCDLGNKPSCREVMEHFETYETPENMKIKCVYTIRLDIIFNSTF
uniref:Uncharacterized protein n=1 Tax=Glossina palpalis gambiensis TaxID=67801 RepID=A0A1B0BWB2_9MUSC